MQLTEHFNLKEFESKDGANTPVQIIENLTELAHELEKIRAEFGLPIRISSGYRSPQHNAKVGGKVGSYHLQGKAADIWIKGVSPARLYATIEKLIEQGKVKQGGLGLYPDDLFVHYDIRGYRSRWVQNR